MVQTVDMKEENSNSKRVSYVPLIVAVFSILVILVCLHFLPVDDQNYLLVEGGVFETLTIIGYATCIFLILHRFTWKKIWARWYFVALLVLFTMRELDFDKSRFTVGLLKSRQYMGDLVALPEKVISLLIIILILTVIFYIFAKETNRFLAGISSLRPSELAIMFGLILICTSKTVDGLGRKLADFGINISQQMEQFAYVFEEVGEMGIPIFFTVAVLTSQSGATKN